jgi:transposase
MHTKKDIGCHRTPACTGKAAASQLGAASHTRNAGSPRTNCIHSFPADCCAIAYQAVDETSVKTKLTRQRGWSQRGARLVMNAPFGARGTQTFIAGLSADAMIAPWVIKGAMDGPAFAAYVEKVLVPELAPGTVVILDNLATHKNAEAAKAMTDAGCWFLFLPPYSPDLNPIEMAFSKLKAHLRRIGARSFTEMFDAI